MLRYETPSAFAALPGTPTLRVSSVSAFPASAGLPAPAPALIEPLAYPNLPRCPAPALTHDNDEDNNGVTALRYAVAHGNADVAEFLRAHGAAEVDGGRLSMSPAAGEEVPETFTNPSPRSAGEASGSASGASL